MTPTETQPEQPASPTAEITPEPATGSMQIVVKSDGGAEIQAGCFVVNGPADAGPICDNDSSDADPAVGSILINGLPAGDYTVVQQSAADGYGPSAPVGATVTADETVAVDITNTQTAPELGSVRAVIQDSYGNAIGGGCVTIAGTEYCDNGPEDSDPANGVIVISGIIAGPYTVILSTPPDGYGDAAPVDVTVPANDVVEASFTVEPLPVETGGLQIGGHTRQEQSVGGHRDFLDTRECLHLADEILDVRANRWLAPGQSQLGEARLREETHQPD